MLMIFRPFLKLMLKPYHYKVPEIINIFHLIITFTYHLRIFRIIYVLHVPKGSHCRNRCCLPTPGIWNVHPPTDPSCSFQYKHPDKRTNRRPKIIFQHFQMYPLLADRSRGVSRLRLLAVARDNSLRYRVSLTNGQPSDTDDHLTATFAAFGGAPARRIRSRRAGESLS